MQNLPASPRLDCCRSIENSLTSRNAWRKMSGRMPDDIVLAWYNKCNVRSPWRSDSQYPSGDKRGADDVPERWPSSAGPPPPDPISLASRPTPKRYPHSL